MRPRLFEGDAAMILPCTNRYRPMWARSAMLRLWRLHAYLVPCFGRISRTKLFKGASIVYA